MQVKDVLEAGGVIGLPTETVWGLACALGSRKGIDKLMQIKDRDIESGKIFALVPSSIKEISDYVIVSKGAQQLINEYLPGPLTLILPKNPAFRHYYFDNFDTIGIRIPDFQLFHELLPDTGPLLLTSANRRGEEPARSKKELKEKVPEIDLIIDGKSGRQKPSTIVDYTTPQPKVLRPGPIVIE